MGFWSKFNFFGNNSSFEQPLQNRQLSYFQELKGSKKLQPENYLKWYKENPFVFTAINERAKGVAQAIFYVKNKDGELITNALTEKLNKPNQYQSRNEWLIQLATYQGIWGTGYLYLNRLRASEDFKKTPFLNLPTDKIYFGKNKQSIINWDYDYLLKELKFEEQDIEIYYSNEVNNDYSLLNKENLLPFFDTTTTSNPYYSESKLKSMRWVVSNLQNALESQNTFLSTPGGIGIITAQGKDANGSIPLTPEEIERLEKDIQNNHGSLNGQSNFRVTGLPVSFTSTMPKVGDLKLNETMIQMGLIIFGAYGLNKELMTAILDGSTFENQRESYKRFIQSTCQGIADSYANSLDMAFPSVEGKLIADFSHLPVMQEDESERATVDNKKAETFKKNYEIYTSMLDRGLINEQQLKEFLNI